MLIYKGFIGQIDFNNDSKLLVGEVVNTQDLIEFYGETAQELQTNFKSRIDEYIQFHKVQSGVSPTPFVGNFTICLSLDQQNKVIHAAKSNGESVSHWLNQRVDSFLNQYFAKKIA